MPTATSPMRNGGSRTVRMYRSVSGRGRSRAERRRSRGLHGRVVARAAAAGDADGGFGGFRDHDDTEIGGYRSISFSCMRLSRIPAFLGRCARTSTGPRLA